MEDCIEIKASEVIEPKFTIAIPTYSRPVLLCEAIDSALNQPVDIEFEVLVVDDNPKRGNETEIVLKKYESTKNVAYYKNQVNLGIIENWNKLYKLAKGKYVVMLHDDDLLYNNFLYVVNTILSNSKQKMSFIYPSINYARNRVVQEFEILEFIRYYIYKPQDFVVYPQGIPSGMVLEREKFVEIGPYTDEYYPIADQDFNFRALNRVKGCRVSYPHTLLYYISGENDACRPEIVNALVKNTDRFSREFRKKTIFPWSLYSILTRRDYVNGMLRWWQNFATQETIDEAKISIGWKDEYFNDRFSRLIRVVLLKYLRIVRKRVIRL